MVMESLFLEVQHWQVTGVTFQFVNVCNIWVFPGEFELNWGIHQQQQQQLVLFNKSLMKTKKRKKTVATIKSPQ